jgi:hypothetical protein
MPVRACSRRLSKIVQVQELFICTPPNASWARNPIRISILIATLIVPGGPIKIGITIAIKMASGQELVFLRGPSAFSH